MFLFVKLTSQFQNNIILLFMKRSKYVKGEIERERDIRLLLNADFPPVVSIVTVFCDLLPIYSFCFDNVISLSCVGLPALRLVSLGRHPSIRSILRSPIRSCYSLCDI